MKTETGIVKNIMASEQERPPRENFVAKNNAKRTEKLKKEMLKLLDGATEHSEIGKAMPKLGKFFKSIKSEDFCALLNIVDFADPIYIALWYHCAAAMRRAVNQAALFDKDRMILLYPLWRFYADEAATYGGGTSAERAKRREW